MNTELLLADLTRDEGFRSHAYHDSHGLLTIGYGRLVDERLGGGITREEARYLLENDVGKAIEELDRTMPWWRDMPEPAQRALVNMRFNLGLGRLLGFQKMLSALKDGDYDRAATESLDSRWAQQVKSRADRMANLYRQAAREAAATKET